MLQYVSEFPFFLSLNIFHWMCLPHSVYPFIYQCVFSLAIMNTAAVSMGIQISLCVLSFSSFEYIPEVEFLEHMVVLFFNFLTKHHPVFYSGIPFFYSRQQCTRIPISPHPCQHLLLLFFIVAIIMVVRWYLIMFYYLHFSSN